MELIKANALAFDLMGQHGLFIKGWKFEWTNSIRQAGICSYRRKMIGLSKAVTKYHSEEEVRDTILHEIAHALCPLHGHDAVWKAKAIEIGGNGKRCYKNTVPGKYIATCPNGHIYTRHRAPRKGSEMSCGKCSNKYNPNFKLIYKPVK